MNNVDKLEIICQKLDIQTTYVIVNDAANVQQSMFKVLNFRFNEFVYNNQLISDNEHNNNLDNKYAILLQVTTVPISVNIGHGLSVELATEMAAKNIIHLFKIMLIHSLQHTNIISYQ